MVSKGTNTAAAIMVGAQGKVSTNSNALKKTQATIAIRKRSSNTE
jgi:hypothetical protein